MAPAPYDNYDYPAYWQNRDYEHESEVIALKAYLSKIPKIKKIADVGCGFGRLTPYYLIRAKSITLVDPSKDLLEVAEQKLNSKKLKFRVSCIEDLNKEFKKGEFDLVLMIRVMHHLKDPKTTIENLSRLLKPGGYLILEFANKIHGKALVQNILSGNLTFPHDIFPSSRLSQEKKQQAKLPFLNYHPDIIDEHLQKNGFKVLEKRSVSNVRSNFFKSRLPISVLLGIEKWLQKPLARFNFGPSLFLLARKNR